MKYIVAIVVGALAIGSLLSVDAYYLLGANPGYFFAKFLAAPVGLAGSFVLFIVYDHLWPKNGRKN